VIECWKQEDEERREISRRPTSSPRKEEARV